MNSVNLIGNICNDIELKHTQSQTAIVDFIVAVRRNFKDKQTQQYESDFIRCTAFSKTAEIISQHFHKGSKIGISGSWQTGKYDNAQGITVYTNDCIVNNITFLDSKQQSNQNATFNSQQSNNVTQSQTSQKQANNDPFADFGNSIDIKDSDLPF